MCTRQCTFKKRWNTVTKTDVTISRDQIKQNLISSGTQTHLDFSIFELGAKAMSELYVVD